MDATNSRAFFMGLENIECEIIAELRGRGVPVTAANFRNVRLLIGFIAGQAPKQ